MFITADMFRCVRKISVKYFYWKNVVQNVMPHNTSKNVSNIDKILIASAKR